MTCILVHEYVQYDFLRVKAGKTVTAGPRKTNKTCVAREAKTNY